MQTDSVNSQVKKQLDEMYRLIERKEYDQAEKIADLLDMQSNGYIEGVTKARILISRGKRHEKNN